MTKRSITQEYIKECFDYDAETGVFTWKKRPREHFKNEGTWKASNKRFAGKRAGCKFKNSDGKSYLTVGIYYKSQYLHRLAWLYVNGKLPEQIDHINGNGLDNRLINLRNVNNQKNGKNMRLKSTNKTGCCGVDLFRGKFWRARIGVNGKTINLGEYLEFHDAVKARKDAEKKYNFHKNHGEVRPL